MVAINPRGSTGYGQKFTDQISKDWTGKVYEDLTQGARSRPRRRTRFWMGSKMAAAGGSYGGFMVNWLAGHSDRFKALISHAGVFDLTSMYGTTEELWFSRVGVRRPALGDAEDLYTRPVAQHSIRQGASRRRPSSSTAPSTSGCPTPRGSACTRPSSVMGVPSRLVWFPDEGHWIAKPANRIVWWREVHGWLAKYLAK